MRKWCTIAGIKPTPWHTQHYGVFGSGKSIHTHIVLEAPGWALAVNSSVERQLDSKPVGVDHAMEDASWKSILEKESNSKL